MRLEFLELYSRGDGPLHRLDPRWKLIATLVYIGIVVATPIGWWRTLAVEGLALAFLVGLSGIPPLVLFRRWLGFFTLVGFLAGMVALSHPERDRLGAVAIGGAILIKNTLAFGATLVLANVTPFPHLLGALSRLGAPAVLVASLHFMYRYLFVFTEELDRMVKARRARTFRRAGWGDWGRFSGLIGVLFLRSMERGERVHAAMLARGWDGTIRSLDEAAGS